jgi:hypothetical protein
MRNERWENWPSVTWHEIVANSAISLCRTSNNNNGTWRSCNVSSTNYLRGLLTKPFTTLASPSWVAYASCTIPCPCCPLLPAPVHAASVRGVGSNLFSGAHLPHYHNLLSIVLHTLILVMAPICATPPPPPPPPPQ